ncbi:MAG TPA: hypothetical protein VIX20_04000 [Ktedonobacteraceae bacterium]
MNHPSTSMQTTIRGEQRGESNTGLQGRRLILAWVFWGVIAFLELAALVYSLTGAVMQLQVLCTSSCAIQQLSADAVKTLQHAGLSLGDYIAFYIAVILISTLLCYTIAAVLLWRRKDDWMALLVSLMLMSFGPGSISNGVRFSQWFGPAVAPHVSSLFDVINLTILVLIFFLFPTGRFVPRWTRWFIYIVIGIEIVIVIVPRFTAPEPLIDIYDYLFVSILFSLVIAQVYRYRRASTPTQRQQTKWVVYSLVVSITLTIALLVIFQPLPGSLLSVLDIIANVLLTLIPISFAIAMLRYRLWDIDIIINRTLVYGTLSAILALIYFGLVIGLESLVHLFTGQAGQSPIVIVASTLAIAALFQPLRHRLQRAIDRRFYRRKYDAAKTLEAFSATLRSEVDLSQLRENLLNVVQETMQPEHVSLWLRESGKGRKQNTHV